MGDARIFFNDSANTEIYTLSLLDALPIYLEVARDRHQRDLILAGVHPREDDRVRSRLAGERVVAETRDRKSTRLNSSHANISYVVLFLKKKIQYSARPFS